MGNVGKRTKLLLESGDIRGFGTSEGLEGNYFVGFHVVSFVHHTHSARAQAATEMKTLGAQKIVRALSHSSGGNFDSGARCKIV